MCLSVGCVSTEKETFVLVPGVVKNMGNLVTLYDLATVDVLVTEDDLVAMGVWVTLRDLVAVGLLVTIYHGCPPSEVGAHWRRLEKTKRGL